MAWVALGLAAVATYSVWRAAQALTLLTKSMAILAALYLAWAESSEQEELREAHVQILAETTGVPIEHVRVAVDLRRAARELNEED